MEWTSLVLFTVIAELAVGLVAAYWLFGFTSAARNQAPAYAGLGQTVLLSTWLIAGVAMLASLSHLGWPMSAYRALSHLSSSWLSREVLLMAAFAAFALVLWLVSLKQAVAAWLTGLLALVGGAATVASGMVYVLPSLPANDNAFPPMLFLTTALVTGPALLLLLLNVTKSGKALASDWTGSLSLFALGTLGLSGILALAYSAAAAWGQPEAQMQAAAIVGNGLYWIRALGWVVPAGVLLTVVRRPKAAAMGAALSVLVLAVAGELIGRYLMFASSAFLMFH
ncbi:MAG TPA: DmsC/YnfH family molybdoenzyme membrane anchor subunit [Symbiobacteriaceae bacterium]|jgi:anaerobic dimethyl sulfoxide reductase subunit C (anchor subunit)